MAKRYSWEGATAEDLLESAREEYSYYKEVCEKMVEDPDNWMFVVGDASYNEMGSAIEAWLGWSPKIDSENFKVGVVPQ
jgi:hypothetical protein